MFSQPLAYLSSPALLTCAEAYIISSLDIPAPSFGGIYLLVRHTLNPLSDDFENMNLKPPAVL